jgi:hypothetical protein
VGFDYLRGAHNLAVSVLVSRGAQDLAARVSVWRVCSFARLCSSFILLLVSPQVAGEPSKRSEERRGIGEDISPKSAYGERRRGARSDSPTLRDDAPTKVGFLNIFSKLFDLVWSPCRISYFSRCRGSCRPRRLLPKLGRDELLQGDLLGDLQGDHPEQCQTS